MTRLIIAAMIISTLQACPRQPITPEPPSKPPVSDPRDPCRNPPCPL